LVKTFLFTAVLAGIGQRKKSAWKGVKPARTSREQNPIRRGKKMLPRLRWREGKEERIGGGSKASQP